MTNTIVNAHRRAQLPKKNTIIIHISVLIFKMRIVAAAYVTMSMKAMPYEETQEKYMPNTKMNTI